MLALTFDRQGGFPDLHILDSTDPAQVRRVEERRSDQRPVHLLERIQQHA
jgi:hypothetical protein